MRRHLPHLGIATKVLRALFEEAPDVRCRLVRLEGGVVLLQLVEDPNVRRVQLRMCEVDERAWLVGAHGCQRLGRQRVEGLAMTFQQLEPDDQAEAITQLHARVTLQVTIWLRVAALPCSDGAPPPGSAGPAHPSGAVRAFRLFVIGCRGFGR